MTDIASLSFQIDTSSVPPATQQLDQLNDAADRVRGSTRFLVTAFGSTNEALTQLATSGRASLSAFEAISQNLDAVTARLEAFRTAAANTIGTLAGGQISSALTTFQQQFDAMSTLFGSSAAQLENFNRQAQYLGMNSFQVTSALQRITEAMQNITPAGQAIRQSLNLEGINLNTDPSNVLQQIQQYAATHANSQLAANTLQELLGPLDPATNARLRNEPYFTVAQRRQNFIGQTLDTQAAQTSSNTAQVDYQNRYNAAAYNDGQSYLSFGAKEDPGGYGRQAFIDAIKRQIQADTARDPSKASQEQQMLLLLQNAQAGSQNAIAAESQFAILNPNNPTAASAMSLAGRGALLGSPISGTPSWYERFTDQDYINANASSIAAQYDQRRANTGNGVSGFIRDTALNTDEISDFIANRFGLYTPGQYEGTIGRRGRGGVAYNTAGGLSSLIGNVPNYIDPFAPGAKPTGANEKYLTDSSEAQIGQQFGYGGFSERLNALSSLVGLNDTSPNSIASKLADLFGSTEGGAIVAQQRGVQQYIAGNATTPGFDQLQALRTQGFLAGQTTGQGRASALVDFAKGLGLDTGRFQGMSVNDIINGVGPAGATLTGGQRDAFNSIFGQVLGNEKISQDADFQNQSSLSTTLLGAAGASRTQGDYQAQVAGIRAYREELAKTGDAARSLEAFQNAVTLALKNQAQQAEETTKALQAENATVAAQIAATGQAIGAGTPGSFDASQIIGGVNAQLAQFTNANKGASPPMIAAQRQALLTQALQGSITGIQGQIGQAQQSVFASAAGISTFGQGIDAANRASVTDQYQGALDAAQGFPALQKSIMDNINSLVQFKDQIDELTEAMTGLRIGMQGNQEATIDQILSKVPQSQQPALRAQLEAAAQTMNAGNQYLVPTNNPLNLKYAGQPGAIGAAPNGVAIFPNLPAGVSADENQIMLDYRRGLNTPSKLISSWAPRGENNTSGYIAGVSRFSGLAPNQRFDPSDPNVMAKLFAGMSLQEGTGGINPANFDPVAFAAAGAGAGQSADQALQAGNLADSSARQSENLRRAVLPLLARGQTAAATLAQAQFVSPAVPQGLIGATQASQIQQAADNLLKASVTLTAETTQRAQDANTLAQAYQQGPLAVMRAQAGIQGATAARTYGGSASDYTSGYLSEAQADANKGAAQYGQEEQSSLNLQSAKLQNNQIADPYSRIAANDLADLQNLLKTTFAGADQSTKDWLTSLEQTKSSIDVLTAKQQEVAQGMDQIGSSVSGTLQNLAFSYQYGPGQGLFARKQISGLLDSAGRSLFNTVIGNPVSNFVGGNLSNLVNTILGNDDPTGGSGGGGGGYTYNGQDGGGGNGSGSRGSSLLGGLSDSAEAFGSNMLLSNAWKGLTGYLTGMLGGDATSMSAGALAAHTGADAIDPALSALGTSGGLFSGIGGFFSNLFSLFADGGAFAGGQRLPFASGGVFSSGLRYPYAAGDVFTDPTTMPMALMGEAGPEAIMPLRRGADGKLGVVAPGGGGGGGPSIFVNAPITVGQGALGSNGQMSQRQQMDLQRQFHQTLTRAVQGVMAEQARPGGMISSPQAPGI